MNEQELLELIAKLESAKLKYSMKVGSYVGQYAEFNNNKVSSSLQCIDSLLNHFNSYKTLTPAQVPLAKKMITNSNNLR